MAGQATRPPGLWLYYSVGLGWNHGAQPLEMLLYLHWGWPGAPGWAG